MKKKLNAPFPAHTLLFLYFLFFSCKKECDNKIVVLFESAKGLSEGNKVQSNDIAIGRVYRLDLHRDGRLAAELCIDKKYSIPKGSEFRIFSGGFFGEKIIRVKYSGAKEYYTHNDTADGYQSTTLKDFIKNIVRTVRDSLFAPDSIPPLQNEADSAAINI